MRSYEEEEQQDTQDMACICWHVWHSKRYPSEFYEAIARAYRFRGGSVPWLTEDINHAMEFLRAEAVA